MPACSLSFAPLDGSPRGLVTCGANSLAREIAREPAQYALLKITGVIALAQAVPFAGIDSQLGGDAALAQCPVEGGCLIHRHALVALAVDDERRRCDVPGERQRRMRAIHLGLLQRVGLQNALIPVGNVGLRV